MSQPEPEDAEQVDTTDGENAEILLADSDDYHRTQRLKEIHKARQRVGKTVEDNDALHNDDGHLEQKIHLAEAVSLYIAELEPLIYDTEYEVPIPDSMPWEDVHQFADMRGHRPDKDEPAPYSHSLKIYRGLNRFLSQVKPLIEEDTNDEWEV